MSETSMIKTMESSIMFDLHETHIEPYIFVCPIKVRSASIPIKPRPLTGKSMPQVVYYAL